MSDGELAAALVGQEVVLRQAYAEMLGLLGEARRRGLSGGYADVRGFLAEELRLSAREIQARLADADATQQGRNLLGEMRAAPLAATGAALAAGRVGVEQVREIGRVFTRCPESLSHQERVEAERILLELAVQARPEAVRAAGRRLIACWQTDDRPPVDPPEPQRAFRYRRNRRGEMVFSGFLDPETATTLEGLFGPLATPRPADAEGHPDWRTREQRQGDALAEVIDSAARADELTVQGGERAVLTVTIPLTELESRVNRRLLEVPGCASLDQLRRLACEAEVVPAIFGHPGQPLYLGRGERHASKAQRRALALRDRGCAFPGCDRPPKWTVPHHIRYWINHGGTDIDNLVLVCTRHHRILHHTDWEVRINPADGLPEFLPPARLDPQRRPLRNSAHGVVGAWQHRDRPPPPPSPWRDSGTLRCERPRVPSGSSCGEVT
ncbi:uncharacterized protein DUF222 [Prauserella muralis]|nr:uncharacterized protein DUF222 [Prauserella muralis]